MIALCQKFWRNYVMLQYWQLHNFTLLAWEKNHGKGPGSFPMIFTSGFPEQMDGLVFWTWTFPLCDQNMSSAISIILQISYFFLQKSCYKITKLAILMSKFLDSSSVINLLELFFAGNFCNFSYFPECLGALALCTQ